jgi:hypothetical protein
MANEKKEGPSRLLGQKGRLKYKWLVGKKIKPTLMVNWPIMDLHSRS